MKILDNKIEFPNVETASAEGILAIGGDLNPERLILAYKSGIFPWYNEGEPIIWYSPDPRMVLFPKKLKVSKSMQQILRKEEFKVTFNKNFKEVIYECKTLTRKNQAGTWITNAMQKAYIELFNLGFAKSVEVWRDDQLVGGLYGIDLPGSRPGIGPIFCGESMFSITSNASKIAFIYLAKKLEKEKYQLIDCQVYNDHLASLGAEEISRKNFINYLQK